MNNHITTELVEAVARAAHEKQVQSTLKLDGAHGIPANLLVSWDELSGRDQYERRQYAFKAFELIIPAMLAAGWKPPVCESCEHQHGADVCGSDLGGDSICWCQTEDGAA